MRTPFIGSMFLTGIIVAAGQWSRGNGLRVQVMVPAAFVAFMLILISRVDSDIAQSISALILIAALLEYGTDIISGLGLD